jgi:hypothetical protein
VSAEDAQNAERYDAFSSTVQQLAVCADNELRSTMEASYATLLQTAPSFVVAALARMLCDATVSLPVSARFVDVGTIF